MCVDQTAHVCVCVSATHTHIKLFEVVNSQGLAPEALEGMLLVGTIFLLHCGRNHIIARGTSKLRQLCSFSPHSVATLRGSYGKSKGPVFNRGVLC